jgi:hypothetical protein
MPETQQGDESKATNMIRGNANDTHQRLDGGVLSVAAEACIEKGNYEEAESLYLQAIAERETNYGPNHRRLVPLLNSLSNMYCDTGRFGEAERTFNRALDILQANPKDSKAREIEVLTNYGRMLRKAGRNVEAEHVDACCEAVKVEEDQAPLLLKLARGLTPSTSIDVRDFGKWLDQTAGSPSGSMPPQAVLKSLSEQISSPAKPKGFVLNWRISLLVMLLLAWAVWIFSFFFF